MMLQLNAFITSSIVQLDNVFLITDNKRIFTNKNI